MKLDDIYRMENFHMMKSIGHVNAINTMLVKWSICDENNEFGQHHR
jgi:hypothetical protein